MKTKNLMAKLILIVMVALGVLAIYGNGKVKANSWTDENGYILVPNNDLMKCIKISHNGVEYELGVSNNHIIKYIATTDKRFSVEGYKIGDEIYKTHTIIGWGNYAKINEEWYAAWFTENKNERSGKIQWFFKFDFR